MFGVKESAGVNVLLAVIDFLTQLLLVVVGRRPRVLARDAGRQRPPRRRADVEGLPPRDPDRHARLHGHRDDLEHGRGGAATRPRRSPPRSTACGLAVFAIYFTLPAVALSGAAGPAATRTATYYTLLGLPEEEGGYAGDPILGVVKQIDLGPLQSAGEIYVGLLAATILFLATNAGIIGVSRLVYSMGIHRQMPDGLRRLHPRYRTPWIGILVFSALAIVTCCPGQADFLGAIYAFGAMLSFTIAHAAVIRLRAQAAGLPAPLPRPGQRADPRLRPAAVRDRRRHVHRARVRRHRGPQPRRSPPPASAGSLLGIAVYVAYRRRQGLDLDLHAQGRDPAAGRRPRGGVRLGARAGLRRLRRARDGDRDQARGPQAARDPRRLVRHRAERAADRRADARGRGGAESVIEQARVQGGRRVSGHVERIRAGQAGRRIVEEAIDMRAAAIVMPLPRRVDGASLFGKTLETVLAERPCRVIIESVPRRSARRGAAARAERARWRVTALTRLTSA